MLLAAPSPSRKSILCVPFVLCSFQKCNINNVQIVYDFHPCYCWHSALSLNSFFFLSKSNTYMATKPKTDIRKECKKAWTLGRKTVIQKRCSSMIICGKCVTCQMKKLMVPVDWNFLRSLRRFFFGSQTAIIPPQFGQVSLKFPDCLCYKFNTLVIFQQRQSSFKITTSFLLKVSFRWLSVSQVASVSTV